MDSERFDAGVKEIKRRFIMRLKDNVRVFESLQDFNDGNDLDEEKTLRQACMQAHKLAGSAKVFGFDGLNEAAVELELCLGQIIDDRTHEKNLVKLKPALETFLGEVDRAVGD